MRVNIDFRARGPLFNGRANAAMNRAREDMDRDIANAMRDHIRKEVIIVPKNPTGRYRRHIKAVKMGRAWEVTDSGIIYGRWLEGTSDRNRTSRFKGYAFFRRATQRFRGAAGAIAQRVVARHIRGL